MELFTLLLLIFMIGCAIAVALTRDLLTAVIVFMGQGLAMSMLWILLEAPDLAIPEAAVGVGISTLLFFVALKKIHAIDENQAKGGGGHGENPA